MELITGRTGVQHVKSMDDAEMYQVMLGHDDYVLDTGAKLNAQMSGTNSIIIQNGTAVMQGRQCKIRLADGQETLAIDSGTAGYKRWDVVCIEYNVNDGIESTELVVIKGSPSQDWTEPTIQYTDGDIDSGETHRMKLWGVKLDGINFDSLVDYRQILDGNIKEIAEEAVEAVEDIAQSVAQIVTITDTITITTAHVIGYKQYTAQDLQAYGIDNMANYTIIGITASGGDTNQRWSPYRVINIGALEDDYQLFPQVHYAPDAIGGKILVAEIYNNANGERTFEFDIMLLRRPNNG